jgi:DNA-binding CsgD family transcriptional regulator
MFGGPSDGAPALTERDLAVLRLLATGGSTGRIAAALAISTNTVRARIRRLQAKLSVSGRGQVAPAARARGLV